MSNWRSATIKKLISDEIIEQPIDGNHGETHPKGSDFVESGIPFIMASDIVNGNINFNECKFITELQAKGLRKGFSYEGDVLLSHKATIGRTALVPKLNYNYIMLTPQVTYYRIKDEKKLNNKFLKYYFDVQPFQDQIKLWAGAGSTRAYIGITQQQNLQISYPNIITQQKIAKVLSDLDAKIDLNNKINDNLEQMAKTLYDYWFVQFDFPDANGKPYKTSGGKMVWNEELKREIPEGWEVKPISKVIEVKDGTHDSPKPKTTGYPLITSKNLKVEGLDFENANLISEEDYLSVNKRSQVETGDILFSMIGNIGTIYKIEEKEINFAIKNVALYKTSQKEEYKNFIYMFLKSIDMDRYMKNVISGSIQKFIGLSSLRNTPFFINETYIEKYEILTKSIFAQLENLKLENQELALLRDWLLPMLMNGQVSVGGVEEQLGMVAEGNEIYKK
jgi:type I restriction enzyme S subunit